MIVVSAPATRNRLVHSCGASRAFDRTDVVTAAPSHERIAVARIIHVGRIKVAQSVAGTAQTQPRQYDTTCTA